MIRQAMKNFLALVVAALIGLSTLLATAPAQAVTNGQPPALSAQGGTLGEGCRNVSISYYFHDDNFPLAQWGLTVDVFTARGSFSDTDYLTGTGSTASGTMDALVCQFEGFGNYRVEAKIEWYDEDYGTTLATDSATTTFLMTEPSSPPVKTKARTATTMIVSDTTPRQKQKVKIKVVSTVRTTSWKPNRSAYVVLEKRTKNGWVKWSGMKQATNAHGKVTFKIRWVAKKPVRVRADHARPVGLPDLDLDGEARQVDRLGPASWLGDGPSG